MPQKLKMGSTEYELTGTSRWGDQGTSRFFEKKLTI